MLVFMKKTKTYKFRKPLQTSFIVGSVFLGLAMSVGAAIKDLPRVSTKSMNYLGAFRIPDGQFGNSNASYSYGAMAYNANNNSIFLAGHEYQGSVAEFKIPELVKSTKLSDLKTAAAPLQGFVPVVNRAPLDAGNGLRVAGMYHENNKLLVNVYRFYNHHKLDTTTLIFENASNLKESSVKGYLKFEGGTYAAGWVSPIPAGLQAALGGTHMGGFTSSTSRATIQTSSVGPAGYSFNASLALKNSATIKKIRSNKLVRYTLSNGLVPHHDKLYNKDLTNKVWTHASEGSFGMIIPGTRTYMVLGGSGGHEHGMGYGTPPYGGYKGHYTKNKHDKYPYYWLYDVADLARARKGKIEPSSIRPYAYGVFEAPFQTGISNPISGGSYDQINNIVYLSIHRSDPAPNVGGKMPVIVAYSFNIPSAASAIVAGEASNP